MFHLLIIIYWFVQLKMINSIESICIIWLTAYYCLELVYFPFETSCNQLLCALHWTHCKEKEMSLVVIAFLLQTFRSISNIKEVIISTPCFLDRLNVIYFCTLKSGYLLKEPCSVSIDRYYKLCMVVTVTQQLTTIILHLFLYLLVVILV